MVMIFLISLRFHCILMIYALSRHHRDTKITQNSIENIFRKMIAHIIQEAYTYTFLTLVCGINQDICHELDDLAGIIHYL